MLRARFGGWPTAVLLIWTVAAVVLIAFMREAIPGGWLRDTDDYMRLMEARDWLAGQSWYDVGQHRMNPPAGGMMHWTRLVDLPIAGGILLLTPLLGSQWAENVTTVAVPLLLLLATMLTVGWIIRRLVREPAAAAIGAALMLFTPFTIAQFMPLRIDHHGWQLLLAAIAAAGLLADSRLRGGLANGVALGLWTTISIEGLPFAALCLVATGLRWAFDPREAQRLIASSMALTLSSAGLFLVTIPQQQWPLTYCDAIGVAHLAGFAVASAAITFTARTARHAGAPMRLAGLALSGLLAGAALWAIEPACTASPFSRLDPLVQRFWYFRVLEGLPVWRQTPHLTILMLFAPSVALLGSYFAWRHAAEPELKWRWLMMGVLLLGSFLIGLSVMRASGVAALMAAPGAVAAMSALTKRARKAKTMLVRSIGTMLTVLLPTPLTPAIAVDHLPSPSRSQAKIINALDKKLGPGLTRLATLPRTIVFAPIDTSPMIMARTNHYVIAAGYHRNDRAMADVIRAYTSPEAQAKQIVLRHRASYLVSIGASEERIYRHEAPHGLAAQLAAGDAPAWLEPVQMPDKHLKLWRVIR
jgi:hypothetical protein